MSKNNLDRLCSLSEEETLEKYEKKPSAPENGNVESECQMNSILHSEKANHVVTKEPVQDNVDNNAFNAKVRPKINGTIIQTYSRYRRTK